MILFELTNSENHPAYQALEVENGNPQYDFLNSIVVASRTMGRPFLSQHVIKALNFHAITCLHIAAGEYRPHDVGVGAHTPERFYRVPALMDDFVNQVNHYRLTPVASRLECNSRYCNMTSSVTFPDVVEKYPRAQNRLPQ